MNIGQGKVFERPTGGAFLGTIIDVVDMPQQPTKFGPKDKIRILWVLSHINGAPYLDKEGAPFTIAGFYNATMTDNSNLSKALRQILQAQPPLITNTDDLSRLLMGRSNQLFLTQEPDQKKPNEFVAFVAGISPLPPGVAPPQTPAGFVRYKDKPKTQAGPNGRPVQTYAAPQAAGQNQANPANNVSFAPASTTPLTNDAF
jgi:hypothetical protein